MNLKFMVFIQLKPFLDIFLHGFSLPSFLQHSLKILLFLNAVQLSQYVLKCEQDFFIFHFEFRFVWHLD
jgi:hypothetical protein